MGVLTSTIGGVNAAVPQPIPFGSGSGQTLTATTAPSTPETTRAVPLIATAPYTSTTGEPH